MWVNLNKEELDKLDSPDSLVKMKIKIWFHAAQSSDPHYTGDDFVFNGGLLVTGGKEYKIQNQAFEKYDTQIGHIVSYDTYSPVVEKDDCYYVMGWVRIRKSEMEESDV
jgi:hypothetical protein